MALGTAACGGGDSGPSAADFREDLAEICADFKADIDDVDQPDSSDLGSFESFARDVREVFEKARSDLAELEAPEDLEDDFNAFRGLVDDEIEELEDLEQAGEDEDEDAINDVTENVLVIQDRAEEVAEDLDVDECKPENTSSGDDPEASDTTSVQTLPPTSPPDTTPATQAPTTTSASTLPPVTLPPNTAPPRTDPPDTDPPETGPPATDPANTAPSDTGLPVLFDIIDVPAEFNSFGTYTLAPPTPEGAEDFINIVASDLALNLAIDEMGVAVIRDESGEPVATLVIGFAIDEEIGMPNEWKNLICDPAIAEFYTTEGGNLGVYCNFFDDSTNPVFEVFSATTTQLGFTVATLSPFVTLDELVDGFVEANT
jgi:hypothetical protein